MPLSSARWFVIRRGLATAAAKAMVDETFAEPAVTE
jgi:hypothetical protein